MIFNLFNWYFWIFFAITTLIEALKTTSKKASNSKNLTRKISKNKLNAKKIRHFKKVHGAVTISTASTIFLK